MCACNNGNPSTLVGLLQTKRRATTLKTECSLGFFGGRPTLASRIANAYLHRKGVHAMSTTNATVTIPCPACMTRNNADPQRLGRAPVCGKCGAPLIPARPVALRWESFPRYALRNSLPVLVNFRAPWCPHSRRMVPEFDRVATLLAPYMLTAAVDTQAEEGLAAHYRIDSIPTTVLFRGGRELSRIAGAVDAEELAAWAARLA